MSWPPLLGIMIAIQRVFFHCLFRCHTLGEMCSFNIYIYCNRFTQVKDRNGLDTFWLDTVSNKA